MRTSDRRIPWGLILLTAAVITSSPSIGLPAQKSEEKEDVATIIATMKKAIQEKNDPMRNRMFFKLRAIGKPAVAPLVEVLSDPTPGVSEYAAFTLGWIADPAAIDPLVTYLKNGNVDQKRAALQALGNMAWGTDNKVRMEVHKRAVDTMIQFLDPAQDIKVRREAAYGLGLAGDPKAIPALEKVGDDPDKILQFQVKEAIERIRSVQKS